MQIFKLTYILPLLLLAVFTACGSDDITDLNGGTPGTADVSEANVTFNLGVTRGTLQPATDANELITSYMIVVTQGGNIVKVLKASGLVAAEMHPVKASLSAGTYKVYAFANIAEGDLPTFKVDNAMPDLSSEFYGTATFKNGMTSPIPMSGNVDGQELVIKPSKGNDTYGIEVVRMVAKLEFALTNSSSETVVVSKIRVGSLTKAGTSGNSVKLMSYIDKEALNLPGDVTTETYEYTLPAAITLTGGTTTPKYVSFYVIESNPDPVTKGFALGFTLSQNERPEETRYALLDKTQVINQDGANLDNDADKSPFIRRNDWLRIPVDFGSYEFRLEARSYPPIGGYPEVEITQSSEGFYAKFTTPGLFMLRPAIRQYGTTDWIYLDDTSKIESYTFTVDTTSEGFTQIFSKEPAKKANDEIFGTIASDKHGTALITFTIKIKLAGGGTRELTRKLYITI